MNDHVTKPIDPRELFSALSVWVRRIATTIETGAQEQRPPALPSHPDDTVFALPGIDARAGLSRVAGNGRLYLELLQRFRQTRATAAVELERLLAAGDLPAARQLAHSIKGVAGNLGACELAEAAALVERALGDGSGSLESPLAQLVRELDRVVTGLAALAVGGESEAETAPEPPPTADPKAVKDLLGRLTLLLEASDLEARQCLAELRAVAGDGAFSRALATVEAHLRRYDFGNARRVLDGLDSTEATGVQ